MLEIIRKEKLKCIREKALEYLDYPLETSEEFSFIVRHPFASSLIEMTAPGELSNLSTPEGFSAWKTSRKAFIATASVEGIYCSLSTAYKINFVIAIFKYLTEEEKGMLLTDAWKSTDNINVAFSGCERTIIQSLKDIRPQYLMSSEELEVYNALPPIVTVYRGVTKVNNKNTASLSWTLDKELATWFSTRWSNEGAEVWTLNIPKSKIICYFENEEEVLVNTYGFRNKITKTSS